MVPRVLCSLAFLFLTGCAAMSARQTCSITSSPPGASVFIVRSPDDAAAGVPVGTTPCRPWIQQAVEPGYLRVELAGYQPATWPMPSALQFSHHFELERSVSAQVAAELAAYPKPYVRAALDVVGKCDEAIASPRMLAGAAVAVANTSNERLKLDFPELTSSALARALDQTIDELRRASGGAVGGDAATEPFAAPRARQLADEIKQGMGVR